MLPEPGSGPTGTPLTDNYPTDSPAGAAREGHAGPEKPPKKSRKAFVAIILLGMAFVTALGFLVYYFLQLDEANATIERQQEEIEQQNEIIDKKETFGAAMEGLVSETVKMKGTLMADLVPIEEYSSIAQRAWQNRRNTSHVDQATNQVHEATRDLQKLQSDAAAARNQNKTGTKFESVTNALGKGYVHSLIDNADELCENDVLACVISDDPYTVHFDAADNKLEYMTDWLRTGIAYHEFAHVLQFTNPEPTELALKSFKDDAETMADCFALTYLDGWTLDHTIWVSSYRYWEVSIGYGYTCNPKQRQAIRDWYNDLGVDPQPISQ